MKTSASLWGGLAALAVVLNAAAQTSAPTPAPTVALRWNAPPECPTGEQVLDDARTLSVNRAETPPRKPLEVDAVVERLSAIRWSVTLAVGPAQQRLEASSCVQLARAAALFVALVMDPSSGEMHGAKGGETAPEAGPPLPSAAPASTPAAVPDPAKALVERDAVARARAGPRDVSVLAAAGLMVDVGTLPRAELLGAFEAGIRYRRAEVTLQGAAGTAQDTTINGAAGARLTPVNATLTPCYAPLATDRFRLGPCAQGEIGWIHAEGIGVSQASATDAVRIALGAGLVAWWIVAAHFELRLGAGVLIPVVRPNFELTGLGSVFEPGIAVRAGTAAVIRF